MSRTALSVKVHGTRVVRKVTVHFEDLENRSRGLDVNWQPVRGNTSAHPWSHSPVGLVSRQGDAVDRTCILCDSSIHNDRARISASSRQCACPFYSSRAGFSGKASHHPGLSAPLHPRFGSPRLLTFLKAKIAVKKGRRFVNATVTQHTSSVSCVSLPTD